MIRTRAQKQETVGALAAKLRASPTLYLTDFTGLNVARMTELRRKLRSAGIDYVVAKNTLVRRAMGDAQVAGLEAHLDGPTGLVLGGADPVVAAKVLSDFAKEHVKPAIKVGLVEGRAVTAAEVKQLASLPSRTDLLAQLAGAFQAPLAGLVGVMNGVLYMMVGALEALKHKRAGDTSHGDAN